MEAIKGRRKEVVEMDNNSNNTKNGLGDKAKEVIREAIITPTHYEKPPAVAVAVAVAVTTPHEINQEDNNKNTAAKDPEDVLAYSRTVYQTDSSLE